jgi:hypothetical protein
MSQPACNDTQDKSFLQQPSEDQETDPNPKPKHRFQERVAQRDQELQEQYIQERSARVHDKIHNFKKANLEYIVLQDPSQEEIETLYRNIAAEMRACHMPIVPFEALMHNSGTRPLDETLTPQVEFIIGKELYLMLARSLPRTEKNLKAIMESYSQTEDGYGALFLVMKTYCPYLKTLQAPWGPTWQAEQNGFEYIAMLKRHLANTSRTSNTRYSPRAIAVELLQQAKQHLRYQNIATQYLTRLMLQPEEIPLGMEYEMTHLAGEMDMNKTMDSTYGLSVNKMHTAREPNDKDGKREGKFQYKRQVKCTCCHTFGHDVDKQICRIGAQVYHAHQFLLNNPTKAQQNAQSYSASNSAKHISSTKAK